ncbi:MAG: hypothetical protein L3J06_07805 [Cyclobacteriaceae bacterium]|nr:hypothetical protein [Cyclobacteriaceae bacterium]
MRFVIFSFFFNLSMLTAYAQQVNNSSWATIEEFKAEEPTIIRNIIWLENNPIATDQNDTKALSENIINWLTNTPYISVNLEGVFLENLMRNKRFKYAEKFKVTYLFGKSLYIIQHQDTLDEVKASARGIVGMINVYSELKLVDPSLTNNQLKKYARLSAKGKLEEYVADRLEQSSSIISY